MAKKVWPVGSVDGKQIADGKIGPVSQRLRDRFQRVVSGNDPEFAHWLTPVAAAAEVGADGSSEQL